MNWEKENQELILKIQNLQEENKRNVMDIDRMERKIEELTKTETEHQIIKQVKQRKSGLPRVTHLSKKFIHRRTQVNPCSTVLENLQGEKNQLVHDLEQSQQELMLNGFNLCVNGQLCRNIPEGEKSLHSELLLAQSAEASASEWLHRSISSSSPDDIMDREKMVLLREPEHMAMEFTTTLQKLGEEVSEVETLIAASLRWLTDPERNGKERWEDELTDLKHDLERKLNLCILKLSLLGNYKEFLDKEFIEVVGNLKRSKHESHSVKKELHFRKKQLEAIKRSQENAVNEGETLRKQLQEVIERLENAEQQNCLSGNLSYHDYLSTRDLIQEPLKGQTRLFCHKKFSVHETGIYETPLNLEFTSWYTPLLDALHIESLIKTSRLNKENLSCISNGGLFSCERSDYGEVKDEPALDVTLKGNKCSVASVGVQTIVHLPVSTTMDDLCVKENLDHQLPPEGPLQASEYSTSAPGHTSSMNSNSSDSSSGFLTMASDNVDPKSHYEKVKTTQPAPIMVESEGKSLINENTPCHSSVDEKKTTLNLETKELEAVKDCKEEHTVGGETAASTRPVTGIKSVNFKQNDHISTNEKEVEAEFLRLSLGFKCDWFTLEKRVKLEERSRNLAEENLKKEINNCLKLLKSLIPLCEDDNQAQETIKKLEKNLKFLNQCTTRVASKAEMLGAINQESRVSKAVEVMIQHVENLKRMYAKEHAELEELKQALLQNERPFSTLEDEDDIPTKNRSPSLNSKPLSFRKPSIATLPRNIGNTGLMSGMEKNDRLCRRPSWRILGPKQSERRPSLQRFISTYSWADDEGDKCDLKDKEESEPPTEEVLEKTRKLSLPEKSKNQSRWDVSSLCDIGATWASDLKTSFRKINITLWISFVVIVLFAAFMSFLTGRFFQRTVDAAPVENGGSWTSLQQVLWPYTKLQHKGPPPV